MALDVAYLYLADVCLSCVKLLRSLPDEGVWRKALVLKSRIIILNIFFFHSRVKSWFVSILKYTKQA